MSVYTKNKYVHIWRIQVSLRSCMWQRYIIHITYFCSAIIIPTMCFKTHMQKYWYICKIFTRPKSGNMVSLHGWSVNLGFTLWLKSTPCASTSIVDIETRFGFQGLAYAVYLVSHLVSHIREDDWIFYVWGTLEILWTGHAQKQS